MDKQQILNCLLDDGSVDLEKVQEAVKLAQEYRVLCEVANALYDGKYAGIELVVHVTEGFKGPKTEQGKRVMSFSSTDVDGLVRNKAVALHDRINELGFAV